jgi:NAD-dependent SIR2 family protein deacetylase
VSFGQNIPADVWARAEALTAACDAFVAVGSSLVVQPRPGCRGGPAARGSRW